jgi:predicted ArsR family transcriptional regulator
MGNSKVPAIHLDRPALAMLAHPLRARLLDELRVSGPATATTLASALQTNSGATSYHLRKLAQVALVVDSGAGRGRQRLWRASTESRPRDGPNNSMDMHDLDDLDDADGQAALTWLAHDYLRHFSDRAEHWLDTQDRWPVDWREQVGLSDHLVQVTAGQLSMLHADLAEVMERYRRVGAGNPDAKRVSVYLCPLPVDRPPG